MPPFNLKQKGLWLGLVVIYEITGTMVLIALLARTPKLWNLILSGFVGNVGNRVAK